MPLKTLRAQGFSVVELVTVIAVLGILAIGSMRFLTDTSSGYARTQSRAVMVDAANSALFRMNRALRNALPGSVRVSGDCLEWLPVLDAQAYLTAPIGFSANQARLLPLTSYTYTPNTRLAIEPRAGLYNLASTGAVSPEIASLSVGSGGEHVVAFTSVHQFPNPSRVSRAFVVGTPSSYCVDEGALWRYQDYGFLGTQPTTATLPSTGPGRAMEATGVTSASQFSYVAPTLQRNGAVKVELVVENAGDTLSLEKIISLRNLP